MDMTTDSIVPRIKKVLIEVFQLELDLSEIGEEHVLFGKPLASISEQLLELVGRLEEEFHIKFKDEDLRSELFVSVEAMVESIEKALKN